LACSVHFNKQKKTLPFLFHERSLEKVQRGEAKENFANKNTSPQTMKTNSKLVFGLINVLSLSM
jgi:hypothetical protein